MYFQEPVQAASFELNWRVMRLLSHFSLKSGKIRVLTAVVYRRYRCNSNSTIYFLTLILICSHWSSLSRFCWSWSLLWWQLSTSTNGPWIQLSEVSWLCFIWFLFQSPFFWSTKLLKRAPDLQVFTIVLRLKQCFLFPPSRNSHITPTESTQKTQTSFINTILQIS